MPFLHCLAQLPTYQGSEWLIRHVDFRFHTQSTFLLPRAHNEIYGTLKERGKTKMKIIIDLKRRLTFFHLIQISSWQRQRQKRQKTFYIAIQQWSTWSQWATTEKPRAREQTEARLRFLTYSPAKRTDTECMRQNRCRHKD